MSNLKNNKKGKCSSFQKELFKNVYDNIFSTGKFDLLGRIVPCGAWQVIAFSKHLFWKCSLVVENLPNMQKSLGSIPSTTKKV